MQEPPLWLGDRLTRSYQPSAHAGFSEYLRWFRPLIESSQNSPRADVENNVTKLELFDRFTQRADFSQILDRLNQRTRRLAQICFEASCLWRIRVGGTRGPEQMLLPAFSSQGVPYIPSSTLKGAAHRIARQALARDETTQSDLDRIFGSIDEDSGRVGSVVFLDAYPMVDEEGNDREYPQGYLQLDTATQLWKWESDCSPPSYKSNPNTLISLKQPRFLIGLRRGTGDRNGDIEQAEDWLRQGLAAGIGAQVNAGYGSLESQISDSRKTRNPEKQLFRIRFDLKGQLIHGAQEFRDWEPNSKNSNWKNPAIAMDELRPMAFRSMLRYWFRAFTLRMFPVHEVRQIETLIFGGIEPEPSTGLFRLELQNCEFNSSQNYANEPHQASGTVVIRQCSLASIQADEKDMRFFLQSLMWLAFQLGGVGQGARRPCHKRDTNPQWRGTDIFLDNSDEFWTTPSQPQEFSDLFKKRVNILYKAVSKLSNIQPKPQPAIYEPGELDWVQAIDRHCKILVVQSDRATGNEKPYALAKLHQLARDNKGNYNPALCGDAKQRPSPIWIAKRDYGEVVTIFGATAEPRKGYIKTLENAVRRGEVAVTTVFPFPKSKEK